LDRSCRDRLGDSQQETGESSRPKDRAHAASP
jgi:hypothetical protein